MKDRDLRLLHRRSGSKEMFSFWYATELQYFRRLFGLKYRPNTEDERIEFQRWIESRLSAGNPT